MCIRLALERKLEEEGYLRQTVKMEDTAESLSGLDGVICTGTFTRDMIAVIELWKCPVVFVDANPNPEKFDSIVADYRQAVEDIVSYLVSCGHTKIGMIGCREVNAQGVARYPLTLFSGCINPERSVSSGIYEIRCLLSNVWI